MQFKGYQLIIISGYTLHTNYERVTNFLTAPPILLNGTAETGYTSELITETAETRIQQSVFHELEK